jgi:hypothetical protein
MSLIYPEEAWARFGPAPIAVHDARGRRLRFVVACDPLTGEVLQNVPDTDWIVPVVRRLAIARGTFLRRLLGHYRSLLPGGSIVTRHYFAPAPLTISRVEGS